ncbi:MAG: MAPEG family protein [Maritimibacter sp.]
MTPELTALALAAFVHIISFVAYSYMANVDVGLGYSTSPRDSAPSRDMRVVTMRLSRAYDNSAAMFGLFAGGALMISVTGQSTVYTGGLAFAYVALRAGYTLAYARGWRPWRSYIWICALLCCALLYLAALF